MRIVKNALSEPAPSGPGQPGLDGPGHGRVLLRAEGVYKTFAGTKALRGVSLEIRAGEVHALVGANGSGKSTLIKILSGYHHPDAATGFWLNDHEVDAADLARGGADRVRVSFVHQDLGLIKQFSTVDNLALRGGFEQHRLGHINWPEQVRRATQIMGRLGHRIAVNVPVSHLRPVEQVTVSIAAALQHWDSSGGVLVLDEPTAVLPPAEVSRLVAIIQRLRASGAGILYVSHRLDEVFDLADRVTVLRNGENVATEDVKALDKRALVRLMLGTDVETGSRTSFSNDGAQAPMLAVRQVGGSLVRDVTFELRAGEILGVAGYPDSGRDELPRLLTDRRRHAESGEIKTARNGYRWQSLKTFSESSVLLVPPDRGKEGVIGPLSVEDNITLSILHRLKGRVTLDQKRSRNAAIDWMKRLDMQAASPSSPVKTLSGGNQQKVLLGRVFACQPEAVVLCEPTAGVDIGARQRIYALIAEQAEAGLGVVVVSSDVGDLVALCSRVLVLSRGEVASELTGDEITELNLVHAMEEIESEMPS